MTRETDGVVIHYETAGETGSRVLLLHGWGCSITHLRPVAESLREDHRVMMIDFPAHGESSRPPEPWGVPEFAMNLKHFLEAEGFLPCAVVAHSFGCRVAAFLASEYPDLFTRIVFTGAAGIRKEPTEESRRRSAQFRRGREMARRIRKIPFLRGAADTLEEKLRQKYGSPDYNALDAQMRQTFVKVINLDLKDRYERIRQSTLLIWGDQDTETPIWMAREIEKRIPDCGLVILEGGSHFAYLEQIRRFNTIVSHFLKEA